MYRVAMETKRSDYLGIASLRELRLARYENEQRLLSLGNALAGQCRALRRWFSVCRVVSGFVYSFVSSLAQIAFLCRAWVWMRTLLGGGR